MDLTTTTKDIEDTLVQESYEKSIMRFLEYSQHFTKPFGYCDAEGGINTICRSLQPITLKCVEYIQYTCKIG